MEKIYPSHPDLTGGGQTTLHSHSGGGSLDVKSGTKESSAGSNSVTFNSPFVSAPQVVLTVQDSIALRDCLYQVTAVSVNGFSFNTDAAAVYAWIATDAGNP